MSNTTAVLLLSACGLSWSTLASSCCERHACEDLRFLSGMIAADYAKCCQKPTATEQTACLDETWSKVNATEVLILSAKIACDNNDDAAIRDLVKQIREIWVPKILKSASGRVENQMIALGQHDWLNLKATLARPAQDGCKPVTLALVSTEVLNPEAVGKAADAVSLAMPTGAPVPAAVITANTGPSYTACTFDLPPATSFAMKFGDVWSGIGLSGSMAIAQTATFPVAGAGQATVGVPTALSFSLSYLGEKANLDLDKTCPYNTLSVDANGNGTLGVALTLTSGSHSLAGLIQVGGTIYFSLPVHMSADWAKLEIRTDKTAPGETYTPTNHDVLVGADTPPHPGVTNTPCADADGNGIRDGADEAIFALTSPMGCQAVAQH